MNNGENSKEIIEITKELLQNDLTENSRQLARITKEAEKAIEQLEEEIKAIKSALSIGAVNAIKERKLSEASVEFDVALGKLRLLVGRHFDIGFKLSKLEVKE